MKVASIAAVAWALLLSAEAHATTPVVIEDAPAFAVDLGPLEPCIVYPHARRRAEACVGIPDKEVSPYADADTHTVAIAIVRRRGGAHLVLTILKVPGLPFATAAHERAFLQGMTDTVKREQPSAHYELVAKREVTLAHTSKAFRVDFVVSGGTEKYEVLDFQAMLAADDYTLSVVGPHAQKAEIEAVLDDLTPSLHTSRPWYLRPRLQEGAAGLALVGAVALLALLARRGRRRQATKI